MHLEVLLGQEFFPNLLEISGCPQNLERFMSVTAHTAALMSLPIHRLVTENQSRVQEVIFPSGHAV